MTRRHWWTIAFLGATAAEAAGTGGASSGDGADGRATANDDAAGSGETTARVTD